MGDLRAFGARQDQEALHRLRVTIKKIKAFARLSQACSGSPAVKDLHLLRKMFRKAGIIRDAGNQLHLLEAHHTVPESYKDQQTRLQTRASTEFIDHIKVYRKKGREAGRRLLTHIHSIRVGCIRDWYAKQLIDISVLLTASGPLLHKARKQIKSILYLLSLLPAPLANELRLDTDYLDQLQDAIGKWHDASLAVATWTGKNLEGSQAMQQECLEKEKAVRQLADTFYLRAHLS